MISLSNINKSFGNLQVLHDISITFEAVKTNLIIGQSGSGKTVLLKSIIGLHEVDSGSIFYNDRDFSSMNLKKRKDIISC
jgi:phospholipid/cholesterol/gamma-HCH transport system ATP-binding protein